MVAEIHIGIDDAYRTIAISILQKTNQEPTPEAIRSLLLTLASRGMQKELQAMQKATRKLQRGKS